MLAYELVNLLNAQTLHTPTREPSPDLDKTAFLLLLTKQMANQDPLDPMSNGEFVSQLATFSSVEQAINLNTSFDKFMAFQQLTQASTLLGKYVICLIPTEQGMVPLAGIVEQVIMVNGTPYLKLSDGSEVKMESVVSVEPPEAAPGGES